MKEADPLEIQVIRNLQKDLRLKLDELDRRIENLGEAPPTPVAIFAEVKTEPDFAAVIPESEVPELPEAPKLYQESSYENDYYPTNLPPSIPEQASYSQTAEGSDSFELRLGRIWLVRIGIVILLTGLVFLGNFAWTECIAKLGPIGKLSLIFLAGFVLGGIGSFVKKRREELATYGNVLIGGGIATIYYATYAAHYVEPLRVISSPMVGGTLLILLAGGIIWLADRIRSEVVATATILLGFYTAAINPIASFSLFSNLLLSSMAIILLLRRNWLSPSFLSLIGCYLAFSFWRLHALDSLFVVHVFDKHLFWTAFSFPFSYWVVFTAATFLGRSEVFANGSRSAFLTINNGAFFTLTSTLIAGTYPSQLWIFALSYGVLLILLAILAARVSAKETTFDGSYLTQGLVLIFVGLLFKFSGYQLAFIFALQSGSLLKLGQLRYRKVLQVFSGISASIATYFAFKDLLDHQSYAVVTAAGVAVILTGTAWMFKRQRDFLNPVTHQWRAMGYIALAGSLGVAAIIQSTQGFLTIYELVGLALLATASIHALRMPEITFAAQGVAVIALIEWFAQPFQNHAITIPLVVIVLSLLALMHWWQFQRLMPVEAYWQRFWQSVYSVALVASLFEWAFARYSYPGEMLPLAVCGFSVVTYAFLTRAWPLACSSQFFSVATVVNLFIALNGHSSWKLVLYTLIAFAAQSLVVELLGNRIPEAPSSVILRYNQIIRVLSVVFTIFAIQIYVPEPWRFLVLTMASFAVFGVAALRSNSEAIAYAGAMILCGYWDFAASNLTGQPIFYPDFIGLAIILMAQLIGKRRVVNVKEFGSLAQSVLIVAGVGGFWMMNDRIVAAVQNGFLITASWSVLAFIVLGFGFVLRERTYRLLGLAILSAAIARLFIIDVWQLETIYRILSFLVLGIVLLALGFLYNRFADFIRKWI